MLAAIVLYLTIMILPSFPLLLAVFVSARVRIIRHVAVSTWAQIPGGENVRPTEFPRESEPVPLGKCQFLEVAAGRWSQ